jgi:hypothetical protein
VSRLHTALAHCPWKDEVKAGPFSVGCMMAVWMRISLIRHPAFGEASLVTSSAPALPSICVLSSFIHTSQHAQSRASLPLYSSDF